MHVAWPQVAASPSCVVYLLSMRPVRQLLYLRVPGQVLGFANSISTPDGGTHLEGLRVAVWRTVNNLAKQMKLTKVRAAARRGTTASNVLLVQGYMYTRTVATWDMSCSPHVTWKACRSCRQDTMHGCHASTSYLLPATRRRATCP